MRLLMQSPVNGEFEGLDFHGSQLRWLVNRSDGAHILYSYEPAASHALNPALDVTASKDPHLQPRSL